jgi:hypothetical protein
MKNKKIMYYFPELCMYIFLSNKKLFAYTFLAQFRVTGRDFGSYLRTISMEYAQGSYSHEEEFRGLHVSMGNVETKSNGRRDKSELVTMRIM